MITLEMVEKLCEKASVSYDEAKTALENNNGDLLEAIIELERQGKVNAPSGGGRYTTGSSAHEAQDPGGNYSYVPIGAPTYHSHHRRHNKGEFSKKFKRFLAMCSRLIDKGNNNYLDARKEGQQVMTLPLTAVVLLLIFAFWIVIPICVISLFFGYHYSFRGQNFDNERVNAAMEKATQTAENIKEEIKHGLEKDD